MKKHTTYILLVVLAAACIWLLFRLQRSKNYSVSSSVKFDTVYIYREYQPVPRFKTLEIPNLLFVFRSPDTVRIKSIEVVHDTVRIYTNNSQFELNSRFLTTYPTAEKLIQLQLCQENLAMTLLTTSGKVIQKQYSVQPNYRSYNYSDNQLTSKRTKFVNHFKPFMEVGVRPFQKLLDMNLGLQYDTSKLNYELGINSYYYPELDSNVGVDMFLKLRYKF